MRLFLVAGEPSGDALGAALMAGLRTLAPGVRFDGVGGPMMAAEGLASRFPMAELSVMGLAEVIPRYPALRRRMIETANAVLSAPPDALVTIDSPDFGLRVAARVRRADPAIPTIHYVAPSVWAWRPGRADRMARHVDHVLCLLPFEPPYMAAAGMTADFVGHPIAAAPRATPAETAAFRARHGIAEAAPVLLVLPGSRAGEVRRLGPVFGAALARMHAARPDLRVVLPTVAAVAPAVRALAAGWPGAPVVVEDRADRPAAFASGTVALAASGTVSLDLAAARVPMVIGYDLAWLSRLVIGRMLRTRTVTLVNLVSETRAVPEFLGAAFRPAPLADAVLALMPDGPARAAQTSAMALTMARLGEGGEAPGLRAARSVLARLGQPRATQPPPSTRLPSGA